MTLQVKVQRRGVDLAVYATRLRDAFTGSFVAGLADFAFTSMLGFVPWRTGTLGRSITKEVRDGGFTVKPTAPYAGFVERGTAPHLITPLHASCLAFVPAGGDMVFAAYAFHPGTRPNPFVEKTAAAVRANYGKIFGEVWRREVESG